MNSNGSDVKNDDSSVSSILICEEVFDSNSDISEREIIEFGTRLGIDLKSHPDLLELTKKGLKKPLPEDWLVCYSKKEDRHFYANKLTGVSQWEHPLDAELKKEIGQKKAFREDAEETTDEDTLDSGIVEADMFNPIGGRPLSAPRTLMPLRRLPTQEDSKQTSFDLRPRPSSASMGQSQALFSRSPSPAIEPGGNSKPNPAPKPSFTERLASKKALRESQTNLEEAISADEGVTDLSSSRPRGILRDRSEESTLKTFDSRSFGASRRVQFNMNNGGQNFGEKSSDDEWSVEGDDDGRRGGNETLGIVRDATELLAPSPKTQEPPNVQFSTFKPQDESPNDSPQTTQPRRLLERRQNLQPDNGSPIRPERAKQIGGNPLKERDELRMKYEEERQLTEKQLKETIAKGLKDYEATLKAELEQDKKRIKQELHDESEKLQRWKDNSLKERKEEIERQLRNEIESVREQYEILEQEKHKVEDLQESLDNERDNLQEMKKKINLIRLELTSGEKENEITKYKIDNDRKALETERNKISEEQHELIVKKERLEANSKELREMETRIRIERKELEEEREKLMKQKVDIERLTEDIEAKRKQQRHEKEKFEAEDIDLGNEKRKTIDNLQELSALKAQFLQENESLKALLQENERLKTESVHKMSQSPEEGRRKSQTNRRQKKTYEETTDDLKSEVRNLTEQLEKIQLNLKSTARPSSRRRLFSKRDQHRSTDYSDSAFSFSDKPKHRRSKSRHDSTSSESSLDSDEVRYLKKKKKKSRSRDIDESIKHLLSREKSLKRVKTLLGLESTKSRGRSVANLVDSDVFDEFSDGLLSDDGLSALVSVAPPSRYSNTASDFKARYLPSNDSKAKQKNNLSLCSEAKQLAERTESLRLWLQQNQSKR